LKALLAARGVNYPFTHSLSELVEQLESQGVKLPDTPLPLTALDDYAASMRYDEQPEERNLDRSFVKTSVAIILDFAELDFAEKVLAASS
jgi:HEPN domain-containing protein